MIRRSLAIAALCLVGSSMAAASEPTGTVVVPWGDWLSSTLATLSSAFVPIAAAAVTAAVARVAPWAGAILTRQRIEAAIRAGVEFGQNAVAGATRGRSISVEVGPAVVAAATKHVVATMPARLVRGAGGVEGIAQRVFGAMPLDAQASTETVLDPALRLLQADPPRAA